MWSRASHSLRSGSERDIPLLLGVHAEGDTHAGARQQTGRESSCARLREGWCWSMLGFAGGGVGGFSGGLSGERPHHPTRQRKGLRRGHARSGTQMHARLGCCAREGGASVVHPHGRRHGGPIGGSLTWLWSCPAEARHVEGEPIAWSRRVEEHRKQSPHCWSTRTSPLRGWRR
jgi:hypothetical protein